MSAADEIKPVYEGKFLCLRTTGKWEYVERTQASGVVVILPLTGDGRIILIEQFRPVVAKNVVALPAGLAGDEEGQFEEDLLTAAKRELLEETGYTATDWKSIGEGPSSPGLTNEMITFFVAHQAVRSQETDPSKGEKIRVHEVPLPDLSDWLEKQKRGGSLIDYKIFAALYLLER